MNYTLYCSILLLHMHDYKIPGNPVLLYLTLSQQYIYCFLLSFSETTAIDSFSLVLSSEWKLVNHGSAYCNSVDFSCTLDSKLVICLLFRIFALALHIYTSESINQADMPFNFDLLCKSFFPHQNISKKTFWCKNRRRLLDKEDQWTREGLIGRCNHIENSYSQGPGYHSNLYKETITFTS